MSRASEGLGGAQHASPKRDVAYQPGYAQAAGRILEFIEQNGLAAGDRLPAEQELGRQLGFSYTVIREAVKVLSAVGRVSAQKGRGLYVASEPLIVGGDTAAHYMPLDPTDITALFECRRALEAELAALAAERATPAEMEAAKTALDDYTNALGRGDFDKSNEADDAFHDAIANAAHNKFLAAAVASVRRLQSQSTIIGLHQDFHEHHQQVVQEHSTIFDALRHGDASAARVSATEHIDRTLEYIHKEIQRRIYG